METNTAAAGHNLGRAKRNVWLLSASHAVKLSQSALIFAVTYIVLNLLADIVSIVTNPRLLHPR